MEMIGRGRVGRGIAYRATNPNPAPHPGSQGSSLAAATLELGGVGR